jgi:hypothetical protein
LNALTSQARQSALDTAVALPVPTWAAGRNRRRRLQSLASLARF